MRRPFLCLCHVVAAAGCTGDGADTAAPAAAAAPASSPVASPAADAAPDPSDTSAAIPAGRFGCTRSVYRAGDGTYEFQPRGFVEFDGDGGYAYLGFEHPSEGRVSVDGSTRRFAGGHLDGGEFVPVEDRPGQYTLTAPGIDERWSCKDTRS